MGRHQQAETLGLLSCLICAVVGGILMDAYLKTAPAIWLVSGRLYVIGAGMVTACAVLSFIVGYARRSHSWNLRRGWLVPLRRVVEIVALSVVYASTIFLCMFALLRIVDGMVGTAMVRSYLPAVIACCSGASGYMTFVQADTLNAKTIASLLPVFVIAGVTTAGMTTDDPNWWRNNFSQLGDRTTFAARMFNSTIILAGICVVILSYFAISELIATHRMRLLWREAMTARGADALIASAGADDADGITGNADNAGESGGSGVKARAGRDVDVPHFAARIICLAVLLTIAGICFSGVGLFRYTPHPVLHNMCVRGLTAPMALILLFLPWLAPQLSRSMYVVSDLILLAVVGIGARWVTGHDTLTNVEALACVLFMGWFIVFSRQIAAIEADRVQAQITAMHPLSGKPDSRLDPLR